MRGAMSPSAIGSALLLAAAAAGEVEISASADRDEMALDDTVNVSVTVTYSSKGEGDLELPAFRDFDVVSRAQSEQVSFAFVNGAPTFKRTVSTRLALTPKRAGSAVIEPARISYKGRSYSTQPIRVRVLPAGQAPPPEEMDPFADVHPGSRDLLLRASVDNERPFVGQQISYSLYLLARINVSGIDKLQLPRLDGFWTEEIEAPQQLVGESRIFDGVPYRSFLLRKRALFALRPGRSAIEPAEVEVLTGFGMLFSRGSARRQSQSLALEVQPLPPGKPPGFDAGNVGQWNLSATVEPLNVPVGQPITFRLVAGGKGNVRDLRLPRLPAIGGLRGYDATTTDKESIEKGVVTGTRTLEQLLVPERTGLVEIPALAMDIFDPVQRAYRTLHTEGVRVQVLPAPAGLAAGAEPLAQNLLVAGGVRPIRLRLAEVSRAPPPWTRPWFWPLLALPPFGLALLLATDRARRLFVIDPQQRRIKLARSQARKRLRGAKQLLGKGEAAAFYAEVARAITGYLADKQGVLAAGLTREELGRALSNRGHAEETVRRVVRVLDDCDRARFAPAAGEAVARSAMLTRADQILSELDRGRKEAA
ncbi:MAG: hypothetical protein E6J78_02165 [Deltaproteobacteria bacterium]|nr:MAG: hypothetical protein E6J78_02165 [Deltaproteobacteria bacterium]